MSNTARIANGKLILELGLVENPQRTKGGTGDNLMVATTGGYMVTDCKVGDKQIKVSVNAIVKA
jgi:hypothetical protein